MDDRARYDPGTAKRSTGFAEFSPVALKREIVHRGVTFPAGSRGIVVHRHADGIGYEVEFSRPTEAVLTLTSQILTEVRASSSPYAGTP